jgi:hypothetical protein
VDFSAVELGDISCDLQGSSQLFNMGKIDWNHYAGIHHSSLMCGSNSLSKVGGLLEIRKHRLWPF